MALKLYSDVDIQVIADAIREKNGGDATYKVSEMAAAIRNMPSKSVQVSNKIAVVSSTSYTATDVSLTVAKTGTYTVQWCCYRSGTSGTYGSQLYIDNTASGEAQTTWSTRNQSVTLNNVSLAAGQVITVRARSSTTSTQIYVAGLVIEEV